MQNFSHDPLALVYFRLRIGNNDGNTKTKKKKKARRLKIIKIYCNWIWKINVRNAFSRLLLIATKTTKKKLLRFRFQRRNSQYAARTWRVRCLLLWRINQMKSLRERYHHNPITFTTFMNKQVNPRTRETIVPLNNHVVMCTDTLFTHALRSRRRINSAAYLRNLTRRLKLTYIHTHAR